MHYNTPLTDDLIATYREVIGKEIDVTMDRPIGTIHPKHAHIVYPINYGYVEGLIGGDGEEQDVYVLGVSEPLEHFKGRVIAVVHRYDDNECKWVASPEGITFTYGQIEQQIQFQEQFYHTSLIM